MKIKFALKAVFLLLSFIGFQFQALAKSDDFSGIKELIPSEFQARYSAWKNELLSTEFGRDLWAKYENNKDFTLIIRVERKGYKGAGTSDFVWDNRGILTQATISLGGKLDKGFPDPIYYPVMNSISEFAERKEISGNFLAATKFAHEFGHINLTVESNQEKVKLENRLMPIYNSIFLKNGFNTKDQKLVELANQMGGTPTQIWENREYWGEATAMNFILERTNKTSFYCSLIHKIGENVNRFAVGYEERFSSRISQVKSSHVCEK